MDESTKKNIHDNIGLTNRWLTYHIYHHPHGGGTVTEAFKTISLDAGVGFTWGSSSIVADGATDTLKLVSGSGISLETDAANDALRISHYDTSSQASVNNTGNDFIQDITLDSFGHITAITSNNASFAQYWSRTTGLPGGDFVYPTNADHRKGKLWVTRGHKAMGPFRIDFHLKGQPGYRRNRLQRPIFWVEPVFLMGTGFFYLSQKKGGVLK